MARISRLPGQKVSNRATTTYLSWMSLLSKLPNLRRTKAGTKIQAWAPDGAHIVYASKRGRQSQLWTMNADGTGKRQLTTKQETMKNPVWVNAEQ